MTTRVVVTQEMIDTATANRNAWWQGVPGAKWNVLGECPVALGVQEVTGREVSVGSSEEGAEFYFRDSVEKQGREETTTIPLPDCVRDWINSFDGRQEPVYPFGFEVEIPDNA